MALSANKNRVEKEGKLLSYPVAAGFEIFKGALLMINAGGYVRPATAEAGATYAGMAYEAVSNVGGAAGDVSVRVERESVIELDVTGFSQADLGKAVYASDDDTVSTTQGTNEVEVGRVEEFISATKIMVKQNSRIAKA